jgi:hypothetical protein
MPYPVNGKHVQNALSLSAPARYSYFVKRAADWQEVWGLRTDEGWSLGKDNEGRDLFPIWPHPLFAEMCADGLWAENKPRRIEVHDWLTSWLPQLLREGRLVSVFPLPQGGGIAVDPMRVKHDIEEELSLIE